MKKLFTIIIISILTAFAVNAQVGIGTTSPNSSAALDPTSSNKGFLAPRMSSTQRLAIVSPAKGLLVFDNDSSYYFFYNGTGWKGIHGSSAGASTYWNRSGSNTILANSGDNVGIGKTPTHALDVKRGINTDSSYMIGGTQVLSTKGRSMIMLGQGAGKYDSSGVQNVFLGDSAGYYNTGGSFNLFEGYQAGFSNSTGAVNSFSGYQAGYANVTGGNNSFYGSYAGNHNTNGFNNSFFGSLSGSANTIGSMNTFIGFEVGSSNTKGSLNTFIGGYAGSANSLGSNNTMIGFNAGGANTVGLGNSAYGYYAGVTNSTGNHNTYIGDSTDATANNFSNVTAIGYNARVGQSNSLILGNNAKVGIGTSTPKAKLEVNGSVKLDTLAGTGSRLMVTDSTGLISTMPVPTGSNGITLSAGNIKLGGKLSAATTIGTDSAETLKLTGIQTGARSDSMVVIHNGIIRKTGNTYIASSDSAAGDVSGTYSALKVDRIKGIKLSSTAPTNKQVLKYNSTTSQWAPATDSTTPYTANNGLTATGTNVALGGSLSHATIIGTTATNTMKITGIQMGADSDSIVVLHNGVIKKTASYSGTNGVNINGGIVKLGGNLSGATTIGTTSSNTLNITGIQSGSATDSIMVLSNGVIKKIDVATAAPGYSGSNGVNVASNIVKLGGNLSAATTIGTTSNNTLKLTGIQSGSSSDSIMLLSNGVIRKMASYSASNGVNINSGVVKLGVNLAGATTIGTSSANTLKLTGIQTGTTSDSLMLLSSGVIKKIAVATAVPTYTGSNGITSSGTTMSMGGNLTAATSIGTSSTNTLKLTGIQGGSSSDSIMVISNGIIKKTANTNVSSTTTAGGDVSGTYSALSVDKIKGVNISTVTPSNKQVLKYNSSTSRWTPATDSTTTYTANNGLTVTGTNMALGGNLNGPTTIGTSSSNTLKLTGVQTGVASDSLMVLSSGIVKKVATVSVSQWTTSGNTIQNNNIGAVGIGKASVHGLEVKNGINTDSSYMIKGLQVLSTAGTSMLAVGPYAGKSNTTGYQNVFIGDSAGYNNNTGFANSFAGYQAGMSNTSGNNNSFFGTYAGMHSSTGYYNTMTGAGAGFYNSSGSYNVFSGTQAGLENLTGNNNILIGPFSGFYGHNASNIVAIGSSALYNNQKSGNTAIGAFSGYNNNNGFWNIFVGDSAGYNNTGGFGNAFVGYQSGFLNTNGVSNVFLGYQSGYSNTTGSYNSCFGFQAGYNTTTGSYNNFTGMYAGISNTTGSYNNCNGVFANYSNTIGSNIVAQGYSSLYINKKSGNTAVGAYSGYYNTTGSQNVFLGDSSAYNNSTGGSNTAVGYQAGSTNTTGSNNTYLGNKADVSSSGLINATAIGYNAKVSASNCMVLGSNANVGIGKSIPNHGLDVANGINTDSVFKLSGAGDTSQANEIYFADNGQIRSTDNNHRIIFDRSGNLLELREYGDILFSSGSGLYGNGRTQRMTIKSTGNVGIGTSAPAYPLEVYNNKSDVVRFTNSTGGSGARASVAFCTYSSTSGIGARITAIDGGSYTGALAFEVNENTTANGSTTTEAMRISNTGNVGVGTTNPKSTFHIGGSLSTNRTVYATSATLSSTDHICAVTVTSSITLTLPDASTTGAGREYIIKSEKSTAAISIQTTSSQTIDGATSKAISTGYGTLRVYSDGSNWFTF